jgi:6,7-dimethyl-8-ribityllumazine synthase
MSSAKKNLSNHEGAKVPDAKAFKFGIIYSEWNFEITNSLKEAAINTLIKHGALKKKYCCKRSAW